MSYVIYHKDTTIFLNAGKPYYDTERLAKATLTKAVNAGKVKREDYLIAEAQHFLANIEKTHKVRNHITGAEVEESVNLPYSCSVASESYWSS